MRLRALIAVLRQAAQTPSPALVIDTTGPYRRHVQEPGDTGNEPLPKAVQPPGTKSPNNVLRETGRCPEGYLADDKGRCKRESTLARQRRARENDRTKNRRSSRKGKHPPLSRHS